MSLHIALRAVPERGLSALARLDLRRTACALLTGAGLAAYACALGLFAERLWTFLGAAG